MTEATTNRLKQHPPAADGAAADTKPRPAAPALPPLLIDLAQLAALLSVSPRSCKRLARDGTLPAGAVVKIGRRRLFNRLVIERWVSEGCRPSGRR